MTRLTNDMRDHIADNLMRHGMNKEAIKLVKEHAAIAHAIYIASFTLGERDRMNDLPEGWLPESGKISAKIGGGSMTFHFNGNPISSRFSGASGYVITCCLPEDFKAKEKSMRFPDVENHTVKKSFAPDHTLSERAVQYHRDLENFYNRYSETRKKTRAILDNFTTIAKLLEEWPEVEPFIPEKQKPAKLPAIPTKHLNEVLGLPV